VDRLFESILYFSESHISCFPRYEYNLVRADSQNFKRMKVFALTICIYLTQVALASEADVLEALKKQETLPENANLTDEELVEYLKTHQTLFEVNNEKVDHIYEEAAMHLTPLPQNQV
ncbi:hypothetical protein OSTOST_13303, partial [Ostertagia ostertagi]